MKANKKLWLYLNSESVCVSFFHVFQWTCLLLRQCNTLNTCLSWDYFHLKLKTSLQQSFLMILLQVDMLLLTWLFPYSGTFRSFQFFFEFQITLQGTNLLIAVFLYFRPFAKVKWLAQDMSICITFNTCSQIALQKNFNNFCWSHQGMLAFQQLTL